MLKIHISILLMLLTGFSATYFLQRQALNAVYQSQQDNFDYQTREITLRIEQRLATYEQVLLGTKSLFTASDEVNRDEFRNYVGNLQVEHRFPGIQGIGFSLIIQPSEKAKHIQAVRNEGFADYTLRPEGERELYTSIIYLEPLTGRNLRAFGYDMYSESVRFKSHNFLRVLEPSAGRGDLLAPLLDKCTHRYSSNNADQIDCIELDLDNQAVLRGKGVNVVDTDFLAFTGAGMYTHILMNPPWKDGADHLVKAFDLLVDGELVAILNAETIRNPHTAKRKLICNWIKEHGSVEFLSEAFLDPDTMRKTAADVALIWLKKKIDIKQNFTHGLEVEHVAEIDYTEKNIIALRQNTISNAVSVFNAAVKALKSAEVTREEADYYARLLGRPLNELHKTTQNGEVIAIQERFNKGYDDLKKRAWTNVLHSTEFNKYLSSKAYQRLVTDFEQIAKLSFTESNVRGFLIGLVNSQGDMNMQMLLDCFDEITKYRPDNRAYYKGWKSNEKHRELAYRVKMTRFIIPVRNSYGLGPSWDDLKKLQDFDKAFAMLDGKAQCNYGLHDLFNAMPDDLKRRQRMTTDYFDIRWYRQAGTVHFYPRNREIIDRLNRMVGRQRQWLPNDNDAAPKAFWEHYEKAETITNAMVLPTVRWGHPSDEQIEASHTKACEDAGLDVDTFFALNNASPNQLAA